MRQGGKGIGTKAWRAASESRFATGTASEAETELVPSL